MPASSLPRFTAGEVTDSILSRVFIRLESCLEAIIGKRILDGNLIKAQLAVGINKIPHRLGKKYNSFFLTQRFAFSALNTIDEVYSPSDSDQFITLSSTSIVNVDIWIF